MPGIKMCEIDRRLALQLRRLMLQGWLTPSDIANNLFIMYCTNLCSFRFVTSILSTAIEAVEIKR